MQYDIFLTKQPNDGYMARPILLPEIVVSGNDEADVLRRVRDAIANFYTQGRVVSINVPIETSTETPTEADVTNDPWLRFAGIWRDDPDWEQFQADIQEFRRSIDEHTHNPNLS